MRHHQPLTLAEYDRIVARARLARAEAIAAFGRAVATWLARCVRHLCHKDNRRQAGRLGTPARR